MAPEDYEVTVAVLNRANDLQVERRKQELKTLAEGIGITVGNRLADLLKRL